MSGYTPGPWIAKRNSSFWEINPVNRSESGPWSVGDVCASAPDDADGGLQEANARLIAAAPDLLEALEAAVGCGMVPTSSMKDGGAARHSIQVRVADMIRAAIAKAKGETQ
jgi:hypothetical protein